MEQQEKHDTWCDKSVTEQLVITCNRRKAREYLKWNIRK